VKTYVTVLAAAALGSFLFAPGAAAAENVRKLSGIQIRAKFTNMQVTDEVHFLFE
jgi:hypothetical protein